MATAIATQRSEPVFSAPLLITFALAIGLMGWVVQKNIQIPSPVLVTILGGAGMAIFATGLLRPEIPLLALTAYVPFSKVLVGGFGGFMTAFNLTNILMGVTLIGYVLRALARHKPLLERSTLNAPVLLFCLLGGVSLIRGMLLGYGEEYAMAFLIPLKRWLTPILLYYIVYNVVRDRRTIQRMIVVMLMVVTIVALMAIKDYIDIGEGSSLDKSRVGGICDQPNILGAFFVYYMFFFLGFWAQSWHRVKYWLLLVPFLLCFRGIMVTFSRGAYLAFAGGLFAFGLVRSKMLWIAMVVCAVFVFLNPWLLPRGISYRMGATIEEGTTRDIYAESIVNELDASSYNRLLIWGGAVQMIASNPILGVGYGAFPYLIHLYAPGLGEQFRDAHNSYLLIAAEMGIPTLLVFLWIVGLIFWKTRWLYRHARDPFFKAMALGWLAGLAGLLVANLFGSRLHSEEISSYFWILCGLVMRAIAIERSAAAPATRTVSST